MIAILAALGVAFSAGDANAKAERSRQQRAAFMKVHRCPSTGKPRGSWPGYVVDHVVPLCAGGPDEPVADGLLRARLRYSLNPGRTGSLNKRPEAKMNRDEYVAKLKSQLDQWNEETAKWEEKARTAQAGMKVEYEKQLAALSARREDAMYQMRLLQAASTDAWKEMMSGADTAWKQMQEAFGKAKSHFEKK